MESSEPAAESDFEPYIQSTENIFTELEEIPQETEESVVDDLLLMIESSEQSAEKP